MINFVKSENGFCINADNVTFEFDTKTAPIADNTLCFAEVTGTAPVPKIKRGDRLLLPIDEGIAITADQEYASGEFDNNKICGSFCSRAATLAFIIIERENKFLMITVDNAPNSEYAAERTDGLYRLTITCHKPSRVTYRVYNSLPEACKQYRMNKNTANLTISDKLKSNPNLGSLIGGGIFWIFNDNYDKIMYSDSDTDESPATGKAMLEIADDLYKNGIDKAMFGIFFDADSESVEKLYKNYGYICTQYDNYNDVLNPKLLNIIPNNRVKNCGYTSRRMKDYPNGIQRNKDGKLTEAWALKGFDGKLHTQNTLCPKVAADRIREEIPQILKKYPYYKGRFIDVYGGGIGECYDKNHPLTVEECLKIKQNAFKSIRDVGLLAGTEDGFENLIDYLDYAEGLHSPVNLRIHNAGRNHAHIYDKEQTRHIEKHMLDPKCRIPLWHLVYHDCMLAFPYWGDSTEMSPEHIADKTLFACLYGCPPLYSFSVGSYDGLRSIIIESCKKISEIHKKVAALAMTDFKTLSKDYKIQRSVFGGKYEITVNFSDTAIETDGLRIVPKGMIFRTISKEAI